MMKLKNPFSKNESKTEMLENYRNREKFEVTRGESQIVTEMELHDNCRFRLFEGYLKNALNAAKITRISSVSLDSETSTDAEIESMLVMLEGDLELYYSDLDDILVEIQGEEDNLSKNDSEEKTDSVSKPEPEDINKWRANRIKALRTLILHYGSTSLRSKIFKKVTSLGKSQDKESNEEISQKLKRYENEIMSIHEEIVRLNQEITSLKFIKFQDRLADKERAGLNKLYSEIIEEIEDDEDISLEYRKNLRVHFERERQKYNIAKSQDLRGFKREVYRVDDRNMKKSMYVSRVVPANHNILSEMSDVKGSGWKYHQVEMWKDRLIWFFLILTNVISLSIAFSPVLREFFTDARTWGYASGYIFSIIVSWTLISEVAKHVTMYEATYNIEKTLQNETIMYFDAKGKLRTVIADIYDIELVNSLRNNLDVSLGRSANDVANLTNHTMVRMAREMYKRLQGLMLEIDVANEEKQDLLTRIQELKDRIEIVYFQGLVDGADLRGQVLVQLGESRNVQSKRGSIFSPESTKIIVAGITVVAVLMLIRSFFVSTEFVFDFSSQLFQYAILFIVGLIGLLGIAMVISTSRR